MARQHANVATGDHHFLVQAVLDRLDDGVDDDVLVGIGTCMRQIARRADTIIAVNESLKRQLGNPRLDATLVTRAMRVVRRLDTASEAKRPVPPPSDVMAGPITSVRIVVQQSVDADEAGARVWNRFGDAPSIEDAVATIGKLQDLDASDARDRRFRVVEITTTSSAASAETDAPDGEGVYHVQGHYGDRQGGREWTTWRENASRKEALRQLKQFARLINPRTKEPTSPSAARLRHVIETTRVLSPAS